MASKPQVSARRYYEEFEPTFEWIRDAISHTLAVKLPGFRKEELKIQIDNFGKLRVTGEHALSADKWSRVRKDFQIPADSKLDNIKAKFEKDTLYIQIPKNIEIPIQENQPPPPPQQPTTTTKIAPPQSVSDDKNGRKTAPTTTKQAPVQPVSADRKTALVAGTEKPRIQQNQPPPPPFQQPTTTTTTKPTPVQLVSTDRKTAPGTGTEKPTVIVPDKEREKNSGLSSVPAKITNEVPKKESGMSSDTREKSGGFEVAGKVTQGTMKEEMVDAGKSTTSPENQLSMMRRLVLGLKERRSNIALKAGVGVLVVVALGLYVNSKLKAMEDFED